MIHFCNPQRASSALPCPTISQPSPLRSCSALIVTSSRRALAPARAQAQVLFTTVRAERSPSRRLKVERGGPHQKRDLASRLTTTRRIAFWPGMPRLEALKSAWTQCALLLSSGAISGPWIDGNRHRRAAIICQRVLICARQPEIFFSHSSNFRQLSNQSLRHSICNKHPRQSRTARHASLRR